MTQDTKKKKLIINKLTTQQYLDALDDDLINDDELYMTTDAPMVNDVTVGGSSIVSNNTVALGTMALETASDYSTKAVADTLYADIEVETTKVDKVSTANRVYGTDSTGAQTTYDKDSFGHVDDVQVGGSSVVANKIASLGTMASRNSTDYRTASAQDTIDATKLNISDFNTFTSTLGTMAEEDKDDYYTKVTADATFADIAYEDTVDNHIANTSNPHQVTKAQVGLGNVDNTSDLNKPVSTAQQTALDGKVDKTGTANQVYGTSTADTQTTLTYSKTATANTIAQRDTGGVLNVGAPTADTNAATKKYVDDQDALKVDKTGTANQVYGTSTADTQTTLTYDKTATANTIVQRDTNGVVKVGTASADTDAVNKKYFNDNVGTATTTALGNKVDVSPLASIVYGTDSTTAATTYNVSDLTNLVDDVTVGGTSVVTNKVAVLGSMAGEIASDYYTSSATDTLLNAKQATITGAATTITSSDLTASKALISNASGKVDVSDTTSTELGYVHGVTSAIQTQLDNKVAKNTAITGSTKCKITYDSKGLVTAGDDLSASDIPSLTLSKISDVTATAAELNVLDGITASTTELNYVDGVTSSIQTQLNDKVAKTSGTSKVYGTDASGNQTTYDYSSFGSVDDVKVGTTSVVTNKIATLGTMAGETASDYYKKTDLATIATSGSWNNLSDTPTTISGYGITDAYTKTEIDGMVASTFHYKGSKTTYSQLPTTGNVTGDVWNIEQADSTHGIKAGDNVCWNGTTWDVLAGVIDLSTYDNHIANTSNPHSVTKAQVGLGNVDNTSDLNKPISTATQTALDTKQSTITGAATTITSSDLTASKALISNTSGKVDVSDTTSTELGYVHGVTSNIQTQLGGKQETLVSGTNIKTINNNSILGSGNIDIDSLPSQSGKSGKYLKTDGTDASWETVYAMVITDYTV